MPSDSDAPARAPLRLPPPLQPGDRLCVIAPSGALRELATFEQGVALWRSRGYEIDLDPDYTARDGYLAGSDEQRRQALSRTWQNPDYQGILCARGGYGSARLLENWLWPEAVEPKWLIGFSDITGLLWSLATRGCAGVHAAVLTSLAAEPAWSQQRLFDCVAGKPLAPLSGTGWGGGSAAGLLLPANLTVATHLLGTYAQPELAGTILALEDVTEAPYRIDRMLTQWRMSGALAGVRGIALGRFSRCEPTGGIPSWTVSEVLRDRLSDLGLPIVADLPFGHDGANATLPVGQPVSLDANAGTLTWLG
ncbi:MAG: LD-carboxypeptidase [Spirulinaceae cyanobacterium SM2_1_0]|nr:LD-carboxypeptidase [Spirulinaceae cyanobacterium SM2_1_0]